MAAVNRTGKKIEHVNGRYLVSCSANKIDFIPKSSEQMVTIINASTGGTPRGYILEMHGELLVDQATVTFDLLQVGTFEQFNVKVIG